VTPTLFGQHFERLHEANVVLSARARTHHVRGFPGPLSVKSVLCGEAHWRIDGQRYTIDRTSCLIVDRGERYDLDIESDVAVETFVVFFADALGEDVTATRLGGLEQLLAAAGCPASAQPLPIGRRLWRSDSMLGRALARLRRVDPAAPGAADLCLRSMLDACGDLAAAVQSERDRIAAARASTRAELHRRVLRGKALLDDSLAEPFDLTRLAAHACLSPHHFHRSFAAVFGAAPYAYLVRRRVERAQRLLQESNADVIEVCNAVGYESLPSFTTRFRRATGLAPAAWREQIRKDR